MKHILPILAVALAGFLSAQAAQGPDFDDFAQNQANPSAEPIQDQSRRTPCKLTAEVAKRACDFDSRDDFLTTLGACLNFNDPEEAEECLEEASEAREEERELCGERRAARRDFCELLNEYRYDPEYEPEDFVSPEEAAADPNPYFPLVPGNQWTYEDEEEIIVVTVTGETIEIDGVLCVEVRDTVTLKENGDLVEDTLDWYAQDLDGNVWYFGEISQNFEDGVLTDLDGSWKTGEDYAKPGVVAFRDPYPGQVYRQEFLLREAEDGAEVISVTADESVEGFSCDGNCLQTFEFTPVEPDAAEFKYYLPGVGLILETKPDEEDRLVLVDFVSGSED